jgi:xanthine dehydrogenase accessory factor
MSAQLDRLREFLSQEELAFVEIASAKGSTPREAGAWMLVSPSAIFGTIGGGQLEFMAIDKARSLLRSPVLGGGGAAIELDIPLGPEIGQCCGGHVSVSVQRVDGPLADWRLDRAGSEQARLRHVYVFGAGHVGRALANALVLLPVRTIVVETREPELAGLPAGVEKRLTPVPERLVREAPAGSAFVILTHDHALDFLIAAEALRRTDAAYTGMIGSKTKKAAFRTWFMKNAGGKEIEFRRLISPIGGEGLRDKRPEVIAALTAAELMTAITIRSSL